MCIVELDWFTEEYICKGDLYVLTGLKSTCLLSLRIDLPFWPSAHMNDCSFLPQGSCFVSPGLGTVEMDGMGPADIIDRY